MTRTSHRTAIVALSILLILGSAILVAAPTAEAGRVGVTTFHKGCQNDYAGTKWCSDEDRGVWVNY